MFSQTNYKSETFSIPKKCTVHPKSISNDFNPILKNLEAPSPGGLSAKSYLLRQKLKSRKEYPLNIQNQKLKKKLISGPELGKEFGLTWYTKTGKKRTILGGIPNDNTLAVSNDGTVITAINSTIYAYDLNTDTAALSSGRLSLKAMAGETSVVSSHFFDPKLIYDEVEDKFILVFLKNTTPSTNKIVICFSTTNNPNDDWNVYELPGNPLNNNRWTDFPAISLTEHDLFITGNLIVPDVTWQIGFDGSIIWQIDKSTGYNNDDNLSTKLFSDITFDNKFLRNLHVVRGAQGVANKQYLLSNRNFDISNDTIFVLDIDGNLSDNNTELNINYSVSNLPYGVPPNGRQEDTDLSDPTEGLQTNDARVLAAVKLNETIQFVSNSVNPTSGLSSIYHGKITNLEAPEVTAKRITHPTKDFGYPNIAWTGNESCDEEMIIAFNHTSPTDYAGISCVYVDNNGEYSDVVVLKEGENYIDNLTGGYERWGDYFGLQRKYNEPGKVYSFGFVSTLEKSNTGWVNELISPDTNKINTSLSYNSLSALCAQTVNVEVSGGVPPYEFIWKDDLTNATNTSRELCSDDSTFVTITDQRGCSIQSKIKSKDTVESAKSGVYPNPFSSHFVTIFELTKPSKITAHLTDTNGKLITQLIESNTKQGTNQLVFSLEPLNQGMYILKIYADGKSILTQKVVKE